MSPWLHSSSRRQRKSSSIDVEDKWQGFRFGPYTLSGLTGMMETDVADIHKLCAQMLELQAAVVASSSGAELFWQK